MSPKWHRMGRRTLMLMYSSSWSLVSDCVRTGRGVARPAGETGIHPV